MYASFCFAGELEGFGQVAEQVDLQKHWNLIRPARFSCNNSHKWLTVQPDPNSSQSSYHGKMDGDQSDSMDHFRPNLILGQGGHDCVEALAVCPLDFLLRLLYSFRPPGVQPVDLG
jgi:hypothetical protein